MKQVQNSFSNRIEKSASRFSSRDRNIPLPLLTLGFVSGRTPPPFFRRIQSNFAGKTLNRFLVADVLMERQVYSTRRENRKYALDLPVSLMGRMDCDPVSSRSIFRKRGEEETGEMKSMARFRSLHVQERNLWIKEESIIISYFRS